MSIFFFLVITIIKTLEFFIKNIYIRTVEYSALLFYDIFLFKGFERKKTEYTPCHFCLFKISMMEIYRSFSIDPPRDILISNKISK